MADLDPNIPQHFEPAPIGELDRLRRELAEARKERDEAQNMRDAWRVRFEAMHSAADASERGAQTAEAQAAELRLALIDLLAWLDASHKTLTSFDAIELAARTAIAKVDAPAALRPSASVPRRLSEDDL